MERKIITISDFKNVARDNEYFLWHFLQKNQVESTLKFYSYFDEKTNDNHQLKELIDLVKIPYFESYVEDSIDFVNGLGIPYKKLWSPIETSKFIPNSQKFTPLIIGFKKFAKVYSTLEDCYCIEGVINVIEKLNPEFLLSVDTEY